MVWDWAWCMSTFNASTAGRGRWVSSSARPAWSTWGVSKKKKKEEGEERKEAHHCVILAEQADHSWSSLCHTLTIWLVNEWDSHYGYFMWFDNSSGDNLSSTFLTVGLVTCLVVCPRYLLFSWQVLMVHLPSWRLPSPSQVLLIILYAAPNLVTQNLPTSHPSSNWLCHFYLTNNFKLKNKVCTTKSGKCENSLLGK